MGALTITPDELAKSATLYRKDILKMPVFALGEVLQHVTLRTGIRYKELVGQLDGSAELGPYSETREDNDGATITGRTLYTYLGSLVKNFSPNAVYQSLYGDSITKGDGLKGVNITREMLALIAAKVGQSLYNNFWTAVRNDEGSKTEDLFNGFDTITAAEITDSKMSTSFGNLKTLSVTAIDATNAVDILKDIYRSADEHLKREQTKLFVPSSVLDAYNDDYKATTGNIAYNTTFQQTFVEGSQNRCTIVALPNKADSKYIHLTTKNNLLVGVNQSGEEEQVLVEKYKPFILSFVMTMFFGCQFESISPERLLVAQYKQA